MNEPHPAATNRFQRRIKKAALHFGRRAKPKPGDPRTGEQSVRAMRAREFNRYEDLKLVNRKLADGLYARNAIALGNVHLFGHPEATHMSVIKPATVRARAALIEQGLQPPPGFLERVNHQAFRRTCATHMQKLGSVKDIQAHLRHATPAMTVGVYMQEIPQSVGAAVESLDEKLQSAIADSKVN
jgi:integrase